MKILLAVDGSDYTKRMLAYLAANREMLGKADAFTALTVVPAIPPGARSFLDPVIVEEYYRAEAASILQPVQRFAAQKGWPLQAEHRVGHAGDVISEVADSGGYDLVIMGSHGNSALISAVLGSVTNRVLARCQTPMLILP